MAETQQAQAPHPTDLSAAFRSARSRPHSGSVALLTLLPPLALVGIIREVGRMRRMIDSLSLCLRR